MSRALIFPLSSPFYTFDTPATFPFFLFSTSPKRPCIVLWSSRALLIWKNRWMLLIRLKHDPSIFWLITNLSIPHSTSRIILILSLLSFVTFHFSFPSLEAAPSLLFSDPTLWSSLNPTGFHRVAKTRSTVPSPYDETVSLPKDTTSKRTNTNARTFCLFSICIAKRGWAQEWFERHEEPCEVSERASDRKRRGTGWEKRDRVRRQPVGGSQIGKPDGITSSSLDLFRLPSILAPPPKYPSPVLF